MDSIQEDIRWLGFDWATTFLCQQHVRLLYECAVSSSARDWPT
ncbi:MAG: hypothetical protein ACLRPT_03265 [Akkermansia muciniphila]